MNIKNHILGFPRIGLHRELKFAQENYWSGKSTLNELLLVGKDIRKKNWELQVKNGIDIVPVGDFSWYDHILNTSMMLGNIPERHCCNQEMPTIDTLFRVARGVNSTEDTCSASELTKWFNTNYHYIVPELKKIKFKLSWMQIFEECDEALSLGFTIKPVLIGPITYLWLSKIVGEDFDKLDLLDDLLRVYCDILSEFKKRNIKWVQIDEPILTLDLPSVWKKSFKKAYNYLHGEQKILLTTYFGDIKHNFDIVKLLPVDGLHIDLVSGEYNLFDLNRYIDKNTLLSLGIINGRNIWRSNILEWFNILQSFMNIRDTFWIGSSCSLLHVPIDINVEDNLTDLVKQWFSFGLQKCKELSLLSNILNNQHKSTSQLKEWIKPIASHQSSTLVNNFIVQKRVMNISSKETKRNSSYAVRSIEQKKSLKLPILPTTTIGSFPQTSDIRKLRLDYKNNHISQDDYNKKLNYILKNIIIQQEKFGLDVLVHGEPERNDMVEYFSDYLEGFVFTNYGWVQSFGSRCVKPPIIVGDINRITPITVPWSEYAQSLTNKPVKGMLTGPVTILCWSFPREDISKEIIAKQIALALRDEVKDLESIGIKIIQIDEPALREGLPLRQCQWDNYLKWAIESFKLCSSGVKDSTQIHTHMCYCKFNDIMSAISSLDVDVITIETSRSEMELLKFLKNLIILMKLVLGFTIFILQIFLQ
ncbi:5-methyltetrahydropteroyltriglutamate-homocysteine S-methyltransferase [Buchnera aphidicola (Cinara tujafilina)]|uniref:5-methyltetrahydropteroyltriglutamate--homocysteine S-methyltransferase n=1 Tax=Buchnera aphidicola (Cinara tujafilina) TaxID=261317 RepID=F7WYW6_9GAMM|nr:5-methyltetrahydropteroyltriglutamate-homocysteine S-methyltransferase [Buchnera aphidicola (Cinara tujafilina)]